jgi:membrane-bound lytic murein transglycosylase A
MRCKDRILIFSRHYLLLAVIVFSAACTGQKPPEAPAPGFRPADAKQSKLAAQAMQQGVRLNGWDCFVQALERSKAYIQRRELPQPALMVGRESITWGDLLRTVNAVQKLGPDLAHMPAKEVARQFQWFVFSPQVQVTGYYEPFIPAAREKNATYNFPVYGLPDDLRTLDLGDFHPRWEGQTLVYRISEDQALPYHSRKEIDGQKALSGRGLELAWIKDPVDAFFLHIQGSGRLVFADGTTKHILYAGRNGRQYVSLGRAMRERGLFGPKEKISMQKIRSLLAKYPHDVLELLNVNPSYVFFRLSDDGPYGATGQVLTPMVSIASDPQVLPLGSVLALDVELPEDSTHAHGKMRMQSMVTAQDTGGAIVGGHIDLFCGAGDKAGDLAGRMNQKGQLYLMVAKENSNEDGQ